MMTTAVDSSIFDPEALPQAVRRPVFMVGPLRAGTTLFRLLVGHHPKVHALGEFEYAFHGHHGEKLPQIEAYRQALGASRMFADSQLRVDPSLGYRELVASFLFQHWEAGGRKPILCATIHNGFHLIPQLWPDARLIHLTRDPRDVARSAIGMGWVGHVYHGADYWRRPEQAWLAMRDRLPGGSWMQSRFEDLIAQPERELGRVCEFLGIQYDPAMLGIEADTTYARPDPKLVEQWRRKLTEQQIRLVEHRCGKLMPALGYQLSGLPAIDPGLALRGRVNLEHRWRRIRFRMDRYGPWLWAQHQLAKRSGLRAWRDAVQQRLNAVDRRHLK